MRLNKKQVKSLLDKTCFSEKDIEWFNTHISRSADTSNVQTVQNPAPACMRLLVNQEDGIDELTGVTVCASVALFVRLYGKDQADGIRRVVYAQPLRETGFHFGSSTANEPELIVGDGVFTEKGESLAGSIDQLVNYIMSSLFNHRNFQYGS